MDDLRRGLTSVNLMNQKTHFNAEHAVCLARILCDPEIIKMTFHIVVVLCSKSFPDDSFCSSFGTNCNITITWQCDMCDDVHTRKHFLKRLLPVFSGLVRGQADISKWFKGYGESSHLCGIADCSCPFHVVPESHAVNLARKVTYSFHPPKCLANMI